MQANPLNVIQLLTAVFSAMHIPDSPVNNQEIQLAKGMETILKDVMFNYLNTEFTEDNGLDFQGQFKDWYYIEVEEDPDWTPPRKRKSCISDDEEVSFEYKKNAVKYWTGCGKKKLRTLQQVQNKFRRVISLQQLHRWKQQVEEGGTRAEKIKNICEFVLKQCKNAMESGYVFHDIDIRRWGLQAKYELCYDEFNFKASDHWVLNFKRAHRIVSRKVTKFVSRKTFEEVAKLRGDANKFVDDITKLLPAYGLQNTYNSDQSGFQLEMHSGRTLATAGMRKVECVVKSLSSTTHSYIVQPIISGDGRLLPRMLLVLKEQSGGFGPVVQRSLFKPDNIYITASTSGKMTSGE